MLETEGAAFQGKRLWLRPGKKFLFGRTQSDAGQVVISDKTISRKHLIVEVSAVGPVDCTNAQSRSKITLEDLETKIGTLVNGEQIRGKKYELDKDQNVVSLGRYKHHFTFTWIPMTFTFSFTTKEAKADPYTALYRLFGPLDIKVLVEYECGKTTHVVAKKRNTSKGLQALVDGKYIVHNDSFIKAIVAATTTLPAPDENSIAQSPLEQDWDENLPDPLTHLPPRGDEPTQRDFSAYAPNPDRQEIFEGYKFIFYEKRQYETLLAPITQGRGKALFRDVIPGQTEVDDFVGYVKSVAGEKGLGEFEDGSAGKGVVVVRFNPVKGAGSEWYSDFNREVSLLLDHRLIEQNEFLDAILGNDASVLRRPLELEPSGVVAPPSAANTTATQTVQSFQSALDPTLTQTALSEPSQPFRRGRSRRPVTTRFKGFDSDDDTPVNLTSIPKSKDEENLRAVESESQDLFVTQDPEMDVYRAPSLQPETQVRPSRKRPLPPMDYDLDDDKDIMEEVAPAATALKKRQLAERLQHGESRPLPPVPAVAEKPAPKIRPVKKAKKEVDVIEVARLQRELAEEIAKVEREALQKSLGDMDIEAIRNLAIVEEMEVTRTNRPERVARADESDRWDDRWNGRKNFKKFRRRGAEGGRRELGRVIVPLEEAKKKDYGIGDDYWLESSSHNKKKKGRSRDTQDASQAESQPSRPDNWASTAAAEILAREIGDDLLDAEVHTVGSTSAPLEIVEPSHLPAIASRSQKSQKSQKLVDKTNETQNLSPRRKRVASNTFTKPAPSKKVKATVEVQDSDDSEDELKFRFRRRR